MRFCLLDKMVVLMLMLVAALLLAACGSGEPTRRVLPTDTPVPPQGTPYTAASQQRTVERLVLPTRTPVGQPGPTALPGVRRAATPVGQGDSGAPTAVPGASSPLVVVAPTDVPAPPPSPVAPAAPTPVVHVPGHTPGPTRYVPTEQQAESALALTFVPCIADFRQTLVNYDGPAIFGPEVAEHLSREFAERRPDCVEQGWNPGFPRIAAGRNYGHRGSSGDIELCDEQLDVGGVGPSTGMVRDDFDKGLMPTMMMPGYFIPQVGLTTGPKVLVHFDPLPFQPGVAGCWLGGEFGWGWGEFVWREYANEGFDPPRFPECEAMLRTVLADLHGVLDSPDQLDVFLIGRAKELVREVLPQYCSLDGKVALVGYQWELAPQEAPRPGCAVQQPTGPTEDGGLVVNWHRSFPDAHGGSACWVLSADGEWSIYAADDSGGGG